ncbi:MAG: hypothetical protein JRH06_09160 [Deltaproteobacteria bacterium]|nr:hypothetical protein [Deltaproteobacteria bacterium]MBW2137713.1 hypothetical protein [Deltaproteobacteria bacterium]
MSGNIITNNTRNGIAITGAESTDNKIQGNLIGTNRKGEELGNGTAGIDISSGAS